MGRDHNKETVGEANNEVSLAIPVEEKHPHRVRSGQEAGGGGIKIQDRIMVVERGRGG